MTVRIEYIYNRKSQCRKPDTHRHGDHRGHPHGVFGSFLCLRPVPFRNSTGHRRNNRDGKRGHKGSRKVEQRLHLAVNTEQHASLMLGKAGRSKTAMADSGVQ